MQADGRAESEKRSTAKTHQAAERTILHPSILYRSPFVDFRLLDSDAFAWRFLIRLIPSPLTPELPIVSFSLPFTHRAEYRDALKCSSQVV